MTWDRRRTKICELAELYKDRMVRSDDRHAVGFAGLAAHLGVKPNVVTNWHLRANIPERWVKRIFHKRGRAWLSGLRPADVCKDLCDE